MVLDAILVIGGLLLAALTLSDVFDTVVVPGGSKASLRVAHRLVAEARKRLQSEVPETARRGVEREVNAVAEQVQ